MSRHDADKPFLLRMYKTAVPRHGSDEGGRYSKHWQVRRVDLLFLGHNSMWRIWHSDSDSELVFFFCAVYRYEVSCQYESIFNYIVIILAVSMNINKIFHFNPSLITLWQQQSLKQNLRI
jgi:hypothetical protein